jgi:serine/threonine protein kinase
VFTFLIFFLLFLIITSGRLKIGDFGITTSTLTLDFEENGLEGLEGDASYLAPELLDRTLGEIGPAADVFSFGFLFCFLLSFLLLLLWSTSFLCSLFRLIIYEMAADVDLPSRGQAWHDVRKEKVLLPFLFYFSGV